MAISVNTTVLIREKVLQLKEVLSRNIKEQLNSWRITYNRYWLFCTDTQGELQLQWTTDTQEKDCKIHFLLHPVLRRDYGKAEKAPKIFCSLLVNSWKVYKVWLQESFLPTYNADIISLQDTEQQTIKDSIKSFISSQTMVRMEQNHSE